MKEETARSVLRIIGITTAHVGLILFLQASIWWLAINQSLNSTSAGMSGMSGVNFEATGTIGSMYGYAIFAEVMTVLLGVALFALSPRLAKLVTD